MIKIMSCLTKITAPLAVNKAGMTRRATLGDTMKMQVLSSLLSLVALGLFSANVQAEAGVYRWIDEHGKMHYDSTPPPNVKEHGYTKLNPLGMAVEKHDGAPSEQELLTRKLKVQAEEENRQRMLQEQRYDQYLLSTFTSEKELVELYRDKLSLLGGRLRIYREKMKAMMDKREQKKTQREKAKNETRQEELSEHIELIESDIRDYHHAITETQKEQQVIQERYRKDLARYRELARDTEQ